MRPLHGAQPQRRRRTRAYAHAIRSGDATARGAGARALICPRSPAVHETSSRGQLMEEMNTPEFNKNAVIGDVDCTVHTEV